MFKNTINASRLISILLVTTLYPACSMVRRSEQTTNDNPAQERTSKTQLDETTEQPDTAPAPQKTQGSMKVKAPFPENPNPQLTNADNAFKQAEQEENQGALLSASKLWKRYLDQNIGMPGYDLARYHYAFCLFSLGHTDEALPVLKSLIEDSSDNNARILLAEILFQNGKYDEALATTYDVLPNRNREADAGIARHSDAIGVGSSASFPNYAQKIRLFTIRGRIFASLKNAKDAKVALETAQLLLIHAEKDQISPQDLRFLSANYAWRQIEVTALFCQQNNPIPERLSEKEFLAYADAYYECVSSVQKLYCTILAARNEQVRGQALKSYKGLALLPLQLRDRLPLPARKVKKEQLNYYESEMKALIERTVEEHVNGFRHIDSCNAHDLF